jgi:hypothetical protein
MAMKAQQRERGGKPKGLKPVLMIGGAVLLIGLVVWFAFGRGGSSAGDAGEPNGFHFVCGKGHEFTLSVSDMREYKAKHLGEPIKCPTCGDTAVRPADQGVRPPAPQAPRR